jgi:hypothetical protein
MLLDVWRLWHGLPLSVVLGDDHCWLIYRERGFTAAE